MVNLKHFKRLFVNVEMEIDLSSISSNNEIIYIYGAHKHVPDVCL
jgi:hypothetical protein